MTQWMILKLTMHIDFHIVAGVIAKWQDGIATFCCFEDGRCYCHVARWNSHFYSIERWQMLLPGGRWNSHLGWVMVLGGCYNQVGRWNSHRVYFLMLFLVLSVIQNLIPDVWQMVFAYVSIQGWIVDPNVKSFLDGSH